MDTGDWTGTSAATILSRVRVGDASTESVHAGGVVLMHFKGKNTAAIVNKAVHGDALTAPVRPGEPVLMHLTNTQSAAALPSLIKSLRAKGLVFGRLR